MASGSAPRHRSAGKTKSEMAVSTAGRSPPRGSGRRSPRRTPDDVAARISTLESAVAVLGDNPDAAGLVEALRKARSQASRPVGERLDKTLLFVERAKTFG